MCSYSDPHLLDTHNMAQTAAHTRAPGHQAGMAHQPAPTPVYQPAFFVALGPALGSGEGGAGSACRASTTEPSMGCHTSFHCVPALRPCHTGLVTAR